MRVAGLKIFRRKSQIQRKCERAEYQYLIKTRTSKNKHSRTSKKKFGIQTQRPYRKNNSTKVVNTRRDKDEDTSKGPEHEKPESIREKDPKQIRESRMRNREREREPINVEAPNKRITGGNQIDFFAKHVRKRTGNWKNWLLTNRQRER